LINKFDALNSGMYMLFLRLLIILDCKLFLL
jgi:hypothetical protein